VSEQPPVSPAEIETDVAIIGAGPVGLFAVFECGMLGLRSVVIDSLPDIGGQCTALYPEKPIYDIPGFPQITAEKLIENLDTQARPFKPLYHLNQQIVSLSKYNGVWKLKSQTGTCFLAKSVIIAAGAGAFGPNRPPLAGIESYEGTSVFYMVRRKADMAGQNIVIAGGGDSAVDWAISLANVAKSIYIVHRRDKFRAAPENVATLKALADAGKLHVKVPYQLSGLEGTAPQLTGVRLRHENGDEETIQADILLPFFGLSPDLGPISTWGIGQDQHHLVIDPTSGATNIPGIYGIGDIVTYNNKLKLILTGFAEAAQAAHAIYRDLHPDTPLHMQHSTDKGVPGL
jgi:thioredoxin reductase (NADPH)